ncbi:putative F-box protein At2g02030 [Herrania umbratica]|uniref:F-box protein At2g02030 n=1 Tax=Herrania umbratica TaxID=108875 RepID=A0A6J1A6H5_9ROSI|nr:putative F-box protein At2g02030 [Herrania umbratica]
MTSHGRQRLQKKDHVPDELIMSIFVNLPVKSLLRFKCISKLWRSSVIDNDFIEQHLLNQQKKDPRILFASTILRQIAVESMFINVDGAEGIGEAVTDVLTITFTNQCEDYFCTLHSCDGVVCFYGTKTILVCNPSTREFQRFFFGSDYFVGQPMRFDPTVGFGRDQVTKEFKLVRFFNPSGTSDDFRMCEVFTLGPDPEVSWRRLGEAPYSVRGLPGQRPVYVNGALHWITSFNRHRWEAVVSFDLHTEKFLAIPHPSCLDSHSDRHYAALIPLRNSLCLAVLADDDERMNIWIFMKDCQSSAALNEKKGAWEMLHSIDVNMGFSIVEHRIPIVEHKNGILSIKFFGLSLQLYNPKSKMLRDVHALEHWRTFVPTAYFESLVPLCAKDTRVN